MADTLALIRRVACPNETAYVAALDGDSGIRVLARNVGEAFTPDALQVLRQRRLAISLRPHSSLIALIGVRERDDGVWLLEAEPTLVPLPVVWTRIRGGGSHDMARATAAVFCSVGAALHSLHHGGRSTEKVLHGAVTPMAISVRRSGQVVLGRYAGVLTTSTADARYRPPEASQGQPYDVAAELYALGVTLLELLGGDVSAPPDAKRAQAAELTLTLAASWVDAPELLDTLLHPDPEIRLEQGQGFLREVHGLSDATRLVPSLAPTPAEHDAWTVSVGTNPDVALSELDLSISEDDEPLPAWLHGPPQEPLQALGDQLPNWGDVTPDTEPGFWDSVDVPTEAVFDDPPVVDGRPVATLAMDVEVTSEEAPVVRAPATMRAAVPALDRPGLPARRVRGLWVALALGALLAGLAIALI